MRSKNKIMKSIITSTNESSGNDGLAADFISELASVLLDVYNSCGKLGTMSVTSKAGIISVIYKKSDKEDIPN